MKNALQFLKTNCEINIAIAPFQKYCQGEAIVFVTSCEPGASFVQEIEKYDFSVLFVPEEIEYLCHFVIRVNKLCVHCQ